MLAVVASRADEASEHIGDHLLELTEWDEHEDRRRSDRAGGGVYYRTDGAELRTFDALHLHLDGAAAAFDDPELLVFASRHAGDTGALLTAHATGNFGPAEFGGHDGSLARAAPNGLSAVRTALEGYAPDGYDVGIECTHHGPSVVGCPSLFVELGSEKSQWRDPEGAEAVARSILDLRGISAHSERSVVGFGGGHYAPRFDRVLTETDWGVGHIASDWAIEAMGDPHESRAVIAKAFQMSGTEFALVDGSHPEIESVIDDLGFTVLSETFLRETTGVPLDLVQRVERVVGAVDDGVRFGRKAEGYSGDVLVRELPDELLGEVNGIDRDSVLETLDSAAIAYATSEGGSLADGTVALARTEGYNSIIQGFATVLERKYEAVEILESEVITRRETFDPELARSAGVEEGPDFGRLSAGESVDVGGERIHPEEVRSTRERRFEI